MRLREQMLLWCYIVAANLLMPLGILLGLPLFLLKEKRRKTLFRRLGFQRLPDTRGGKQPIWVHALSLGETLSCVSLMEELRQRVRDRPIYFSVSTLSAMQMASDRIGGFVDGLFYFPFDLWWSTHRVLTRISPCLVVFIETDIWPGFQYQLRRTGTPAVLVNGRLSPASYRACSRFRSLFAPALNTFHRVYPQSKTEAQRYAEIGVASDKLGRVGNLKFDVASRPPKSGGLSALRKRLGLEPADLVLLAGSTHAGEERQVIEAYAAVRKNMPGIRLIVVPRHPTRADEVVAQVKQRGWNVQTFTAIDNQKPWDVLVVDAVGVLSLLYHLAIVSFVGGSLVRKGGQNPLEAAAAGCPVMFGPDMSDFPDIAKWLKEGGAALEVSNATLLGEAWMKVLSDGAARQQMRDACLRTIEEHGGSTSLMAEEISVLTSAANRIGR